VELPVGVASPASFLPSDIGVSLCTTDLPLRFSEVVPICAPLLRSALLATAHRNGYEQNHENDRDRDYGNDDAGAHPASPVNRSSEHIDTHKGERETRPEQGGSQRLERRTR
jgi:hypothetical protein